MRNPRGLSWVRAGEGRSRGVIIDGGEFERDGMPRRRGCRRRHGSDGPRARLVSIGIPAFDFGEKVQSG